MKAWRIIIALPGCFLLVGFFRPGHLAAQAQPNFSLDSFIGTYNLDRDKNNVSVLNAEEVLVARFSPDSRFYGLKRSIQTGYQDHSISLKVISVTDASGNSLPYQLEPDASGNKVINIGDPRITVFNLQTYRIKYQSRGVVNFYGDRDEFLLNVNGRGWEQTFGKTEAIIHIPKALADNLAGQPACYIGSQDKTFNDCEVKSQPGTDDTIVTGRATSRLTAHQGLVVKIDFKKGTFSQVPKSRNIKLYLGGLLLVAGLLYSFRLLRKKKNQNAQ